ncbi:hypothetical protein [Chryseobacterium sp. Marseille-Q8038]
MTNISLQSLIENLNKNDESESLIYRKSLSTTVDLAKVWGNRPKPTDSITSSDGPDTFYFIKNNENSYVAAVYDMKKDLHWFVLPEYRGKGHLTNAMKDTILPHLFLSRQEQRITIDAGQIDFNFNASEKVALNLGFSPKNDTEYFLSKEGYSTYNTDFQKTIGFSEDRIQELRKQINYLSRSLWAIQTEVEMKLGITDYSEDLADLVHEIRSHTWKLEDAWWQSKDVNN